MTQICRVLAVGVAAGLLTLSLSAAPAYADESNRKSDDSSPPPTRVFEGGVKGTVLLFDDGVGKITLVREAIQESTQKIIKESTRKDTVVAHPANYIGNGIVIPAIGGVGGVMQMGELPIRKDRLDRYMYETEKNIEVLQNYMDALQIPPEKAKRVDPVYTSMRDTMQTVGAELEKLKTLSGAKRLNNLKIAKSALHIYDAMNKLEKQRADLMVAADPSINRE